MRTDPSDEDSLTQAVQAVGLVRFLCQVWPLVGHICVLQRGLDLANAEIRAEFERFVFQARAQRG